MHQNELNKISLDCFILYIKNIYRIKLVDKLEQKL